MWHQLKFELAPGSQVSTTPKYSYLENKFLKEILQEKLQNKAHIYIRQNKKNDFMKTVIWCKFLYKSSYKVFIQVP